MSKTTALFSALLLLLAPALALAQGSLFYLEIQGVAGYSSSPNKLIFYSHDQDEVMQKPSLGFDYVQRFSTSTKDIGLLAIQGRLAVNAEGDTPVEPQLYNAFFKYKAPGVDIWVGHSRPAFGLSSYFDTHASLLQTLTMNGYGFDRDWGLGVSRDFSRGNMGLSLTTGSGMPLYFKGNYLISGRISYGLLNQDNYNAGFSAAYGRILDTVGYHLLSSDPGPYEMLGVDFAYFWNNWESRVEVQAGKKMGESALALYWRAGVNLLEEGRLKLEVQPVFLKQGAAANLDFAAGITWLATKDVTLRAMYAHDQMEHGSRIIFQVYFYQRMPF